MTRIEVTNKFTGSKTVYEVPAGQAWTALNHYRGSWNVSSARFI